VARVFLPHMTGAAADPSVRDVGLDLRRCETTSSAAQMESDMLDKLLYYAVTFAEAGLAIFGVSGVYEQPRYTVREDLGAHLEIRDYGPRIAVEATVVAPDNRKANNIAFDLLFAYITGANETNGLVAMTAPVQQAAMPELIAMTAPVWTASRSDPDGIGLSMRFFLPAAVAHNPPRPLDSRVRIVSLPPDTIATLRFSGVLDDARRAARERELLDRLVGTNWQSTGKPYVLAYDPPFTISFLRRNELAVGVTPR
jgi:hypothetical protein